MSELLNQKIFQSKSFKSLQLILKNSCIKDSIPSMPYNEFENIVIAFIKEIMNLYLENTEFCNDMCSCVIRDLDLCQVFGHKISRFFIFLVTTQPSISE